MAKLFASETCEEVALEAMRIFGGYGYTKEFRVERYYRDAPLMIIGEGGLVYRLVHRGTPVQVVFLTNGDGFPRALQQDLDVAKPTDSDFVALGRLRQREALAATRELGLAKRSVRFLGFPDGGLDE